MSKTGRYVNVGFCIRAIDKVLSDKRRSFLLKLMKQVMKGQVWANANGKA